MAEFRLDMRLTRLGGRKTKLVSGKHGIDTSSEFEVLKAAVRGLYRRGQDSVLSAFFRDQLTARDLIRAYQQHEVNEDFVLADLDSYEALLGWATSDHYVAEARKLNGAMIRRHEKRLRGVVVGQLDRLLIEMKRDGSFENATSQFNKLRSVILGYLAENSTGGRRNGLHEKVRRVQAYPTATHKRRNIHKPLSVRELDRFRRSTKIKKSIFEWIYFLCLHGMRIKEAFEDGLEVESLNGYRVLHIKGTKTESSDRKVPLIMELPAESITKVQLRRAMKKLGRTPYDCRRTYAHWCRDAKVPQHVIQRWMGHSTVRTTTDIYLQGEISADLKRYGVVFKDWFVAARKQVGDDETRVAEVLSDIDSDGSELQRYTMTDITDKLNEVLWQWRFGENAWLRNLYEVDSISSVDFEEG